VQPEVSALQAWAGSSLAQHRQAGTAPGHSIEWHGGCLVEEMVSGCGVEVHR
jgi:hypothetical protein